MKQPCLHLGAHKTATTWLQSRLAGGLPVLRRLGIDYEPLDRLRDLVSDPFEVWLRDGQEDARAQVAARLGRLLTRGRGERIILSDENLIGNCNGIVRSGLLYGNLAPRLAALQALLPTPAATVVITIRDYAPFFASAYGEALRHGPFRPFEGFRRKLVTEDGLWLRVVEQLVAAFGAERLRVMRYEALEAKLPDLLAVLCGQPLDPDLLPQSDNRREGFSGEAVRALHTIAGLSDADVARRAVPAVMRNFPRSATRPAFAPWTAEERERLGALYATHLQEIGRRWPGILI